MRTYLLDVYDAYSSFRQQVYSFSTVKKKSQHFWGDAETNAVLDIFG